MARPRKTGKRVVRLASDISELTRNLLGMVVQRCRSSKLGLIQSQLEGRSPPRDHVVGQWAS